MVRCLLATALLLDAGAIIAGPDSPKPNDDKPAVRTDLEGEPLPPGVLARMGSGRLRSADMLPDLLLFAPTGKTLIAGGLRQGAVRVWDVETGKLRRRMVIGPDPDGDRSLQGMALSREGNLIVLENVVGGRDTCIRTIDLASGKELGRRELKLPEEPLGPPVVSPDGKTLTAAFASGSVRLYEIERGRETLRIPIQEQDFRVALAWSADTRRLAIAFGRTIRVHDTAHGKLAEFQHPDGFATPAHVKLSADGRLLASLADGKPESSLLILWSVDDGKERHRELKGPFRIVRFSPDGKHLAMAALGEKLSLLDTKTGKMVRQFPEFAAWSAAFAPDGKTLATGHYAFSLWDIASGRRLPASAAPASDQVVGLRFADAGKRLLGATRDIIAWDPNTGKELGRRAKPDFPGSLIASSDESLLATRNSESNRVSIWHASTGKEVSRIEGKDWLRPLMFAGNSRLVTCGPSGLQVWEVKTGKLLNHVTQGGRFDNAEAVSPDGKWLAFWSVRQREFTLGLWDLDAGREAKRFPFHYPSVAVAFSNDSRLMAAAGDMGPRSTTADLRIWDIATGQTLVSWQAPRRPIACLAFSPDRRTLAIGGGEGGALYLWEIASRRLRQEFKGHEAHVWSVAFSPDGKTLAAANSDAPVFVWGVFAGHPAPRKLAEADLERCWKDLAGDDAPAAFRAIRMLSTAPEQALPFLRERLKPKQPPDAERVGRLVAVLDDPKFGVRQKASDELEKLGDGAIGMLQKALAKAAGEEGRQRLEKIISRLQALTPERLREIRAVEALEWMATPEAMKLLEALERGVAGARLTTEAAEARSRLAKTKQ